MQIAVFKCFDPKASRKHLWERTAKGKDVTLKYQNKFFLLEEFQLDLKLASFHSIRILAEAFSKVIV